MVLFVANLKRKNSLPGFLPPKGAIVQVGSKFDVRPVSVRLSVCHVFSPISSAVFTVPHFLDQLNRTFREPTPLFETQKVIIFAKK